MNQRRRGIDVAPIGSNGPAFWSDHGDPLPALGSTGDTYLDLDTANVWVKIDGEWSLEANFSTGTSLASDATPLPPSLSGAPGASSLLSRDDHQHPESTATVDPGVNGFRLSSTPTDTTHADGTALTTIYLAPVKSDRISLIYGGVWTTFAASGVLYTLAGRTANLPFDVFAYYNGTAVALDVANWSSSSSRNPAVALAKLRGVWVKSGDVTRRYLGTVRPRTATSYRFITGAFLDDGQLISCDYWNVDNRKPLALQILGPSGSYAYTSTAFRQLAGNSNAQIDVVTGIGGADGGNATRVIAVSSASSSNATAVKVRIGIGVNSTTASSGRTGEGSVGTAIPADVLFTEIGWNPPTGLVSYVWLESGNTGVTFAGTGGGGGGPSVPAMEALVWY